MIESLFGYANADKNKNDKKGSSGQAAPQFVQILEPKKGQNLSILLRALNATTEEVCDALREGKPSFSSSSFFPMWNGLNLSSCNTLQCVL